MARYIDWTKNIAATGLEKPDLDRPSGAMKDLRRMRLIRISALLVGIFVALFGAAAYAGPCNVPDGARRVNVRDFHAVGDGKTDDGPAIRAALKSALDGPKPASVEFDAGKIYRVATFEDTYAFQMLNTQKITLLGNGAELLLLPPNKVLRISNSSEINVCGLTIDYSPLPFTQGLVVAADPTAGTFDLEIERGFDVPSVDDNSVTDNSKVWLFATPYKSPVRLERRVWIKSVHAAPGNRRIRITLNNSSANLQRLVPNETHLVMAMPAMGQMGGYAFRILDNDRVHLESINIYSVPQFTFSILNNLGPVSFSKIEQRRRPGTDRVMTGWRDVFDARHNRAPIVWDGCYIERAFDDSFNLHAVFQLVTEKLSADSWRLQNLSVGGAPIFKPGDRLQAIDHIPERKLLGESKIVSVTQNGQESKVTISPPLPLKARLEYCKDVSDLQDACGSRVIDLDAANEGSIIRNCVVHGSMRFHGKVTVESSKLDGYLQIASDPTRVGPLPSGSVIRNSELSGTIRIGSDGNTGRGWKYNKPWDSGERWARNIIFQNDRIMAKFHAEGASFSLIDDDIVWPIRRKFQLKNSGPIFIKNLSANGGAIADPMRYISIGPNMTDQDIAIDSGKR